MTVIFYGWFLIEEGSFCRFPDGYDNVLRIVRWVAIISGPIMSILLWDIRGFIHFFHIALLGPLSIRIHILFTNPSEVIFLREFIGKGVICRFDDSILIEGILRKEESYYLDLDTGVEPQEKCLLYIEDLISISLRATNVQSIQTERTDGNTEPTSLVDNHSQLL